MTSLVNLFHKALLGFVAMSGVAGTAAMAADVAALPQQSATSSDVSEIRRTTDGLPHIRSATWRGVGVGIGRAQAEDALCTLAEVYATFEGRRSFYFGEHERPAQPSTFGRPENVQSDAFFLAYMDSERIQKFRASQPAELLALIDGFAAGYDAQLDEWRSGRSARPQPSCLAQAWVRPITPDDVVRRLLAVAIAAGDSKFIAEITSAEPPGLGAGGERLSSRDDPGWLSAMGDSAALGSNALAFGRTFTGRGESVLFGNPHWFWSGPDRFYQMQLTIPGQLDVAGVAFLGVPVIMIGFNHDVAWTHTVSAARRFGFEELLLAPDRPLTYMVDGGPNRVRRINVRIPVRRPDGVEDHVDRTLYRTKQGWIVDLSRRMPGLGWSTTRAFALRDVNEENDRLFRQFLRWNRASSVTQFADIQRQEQAAPWVHTLAIGRADGRVWYADVGPVPNVPDSLRASCTTEIGRRFASRDPSIPFLDGSRSECEWRADRTAVQGGSMPASEQPAGWSDGVRASMNGSYWLADVDHPIEGFARTMGGEGYPPSPRARMGHLLIDELRAVAPLPPNVFAATLRRKVLEARSWSAERYLGTVLQQTCKQGTPAPADEDQYGRDLRSGCAVLASWDGRAEMNSRGAVLWQAFWEKLSSGGDAALYSQSYDRSTPWTTPVGLRASDAITGNALVDAVHQLRGSALPLDVATGDWLRAGTDSSPIRLFGGCDSVGYFVINCDESGSHRIDNPRFVGETYLQVVRFGPDGPLADTLLAHGEQENRFALAPIDPGVARFGGKSWLQFPFSETQIGRDPYLTRETLNATGADEAAPALSRSAQAQGSASQSAHTQTPKESQ